jgi:D-alanyl-D-alanine carboxypeptidase
MATKEKSEPGPQLEALLRGLLKNKGVHHAVLAIESLDRSFRWAGAVGQAHPDGAAMTVDTPFWIASVTKMFIATTILKLWEEGALSLDDPIAAHLPQSMVEGLHRTKDGVDHSDQITIRHLLSHTSGLPDYLEIKLDGGKSLFDRVLEEGDRAWSIADSIEIVQKANKPLFPPQPPEARKKKARYSDTNFQLLIAIIEAISGKPVHSAFEDMICRPLNLRNTFLPGSTPAETVPPVAVTWAKDQPLVDIPLAINSFRDLISTADDLLAFMRALLCGEAFARPSTVELMKSNWNRFGFLISPVAPGWPMEYGLGMMRYQVPFPISLFINVPEVIGHTGASSAWLFYSPSLDLLTAGTVSQVTAGAVPFRTVQKLGRIFTTRQG